MTVFISVSVPDPPTDLRALNVTDTKALLLWRPALAAIDKYAIVYGSGTGDDDDDAVDSFVYLCRRMIQIL